jgi:hypothetical protein
VHQKNLKSEASPALLLFYSLTPFVPNLSRDRAYVRNGSVSTQLPVRLCVAPKLRLQTPFFNLSKRDIYHSSIHDHHLSKDTKETTTTKFRHRVYPTKVQAPLIILDPFHYLVLRISSSLCMVSTSLAAMGDVVVIDLLSRDWEDRTRWPSQRGRCNRDL